MEFSNDKVKRAFARAANSYNEAAVVQKEIVERLLEKLRLIHFEKVDTLLDIGSGTGLASHQLRQIYGRRAYNAVDFALPMLLWARQHHAHERGHALCADMHALPLANLSVDMVFSASTFQWSHDLPQVFNECHRVLREDGMMIFSSFGPDTLKELRQCFAQVDSAPHVSEFMDIRALGDILLANGFAKPVMESEVITVEYAQPMDLLRDLKATGATNHLKLRSRGLMGPRQLRAVLAEYENFRLDNGKYPASYEVLYGHGRKATVAMKSQSDENHWQPVKFSRNYPI